VMQERILVAEHSKRPKGVEITLMCSSGCGTEVSREREYWREGEYWVLESLAQAAYDVRCESCAERKIEIERRARELTSVTPASWFDPAYAGEAWGEDNY